MDWKDTLVNFLKSQLGRNGPPLNYVLMDNQGTFIKTNTNFLEDYFDRALLKGIAFYSNASKVSSYLFQLISEKSITE